MKANQALFMHTVIVFQHFIKVNIILIKAKNTKKLFEIRLFSQSIQTLSKVSLSYLTRSFKKSMPFFFLILDFIKKSSRFFHEFFRILSALA